MNQGLGRQQVRYTRPLVSVCAGVGGCQHSLNKSYSLLLREASASFMPGPPRTLNPTLLSRTPEASCPGPLPTPYPTLTHP